MCKLAIMPSIPQANAAKTLAFAKALTKYLTLRDNHAFGVAAIGQDRDLYTGRWTSIKDAWRPARVPRQLKAPPRYSNLSRLAPSAGDDTARSEVIGVLPKQPRALLLHARWATNGSKGDVANAHPHVSPDRTTVLIHNGIVSTQGLDLRRSQCDSEGILNAYADSMIAESTDPREWQAGVVDRLSGYYALGVLSQRSSDGAWQCDVVRDALAPLYYCELPGGVPLYLTDLAHARSAAKDVGIKLSAYAKVSKNSVLRIDVETGAEVYAGGIMPREYASRTSRYTAEDRAWAAHMGLGSASDPRVIDLTQDDGPRYVTKLI